MCIAVLDLLDNALCHRFSIPETQPALIPQARSGTATTSMLPPILKAYPSQGSLAATSSSGSCDLGLLRNDSASDHLGKTLEALSLRTGPQAQHSSSNESVSPLNSSLHSLPDFLPSTPLTVLQRGSHAAASGGNGQSHEQENSRVHGGMPSFAQHLGTLQADELRQRCQLLLDMPAMNEDTTGAL